MIGRSFSGDGTDQAGDPAADVGVVGPRPEDQLHGGLVHGPVVVSAVRVSARIILPGTVSEFIRQVV